MNEILTVADVAEILHCDVKTVSERLVSGDLPGTKFGRSWVVPAAALYQRVNEIAIEKSEERRKAAPPVLPAPDANAPKRRGRKRFIYSALD